MPYVQPLSRVWRTAAGRRGACPITTLATGPASLSLLLGRSRNEEIGCRQIRREHHLCAEFKRWRKGNPTPPRRACQEGPPDAWRQCYRRRGRRHDGTQDEIAAKEITDGSCPIWCAGRAIRP